MIDALLVRAALYVTSWETLHIGEHPDAVDEPWSCWKYDDRFIRFAGRTAIEHQVLEIWHERALAETNPLTSM